MKKFFSLIAITIIATMLFTCVTAFASNDDVEITFCVGDSTLIINGVAQTVETPYVVGDGVTLVPVRVITEAFGATVDWDHDTKTVTLNYPGVNINLQINNPVADVNGMAQTLLAAPELTNTSTMVPLRFISENFGADVSYDPVTEKITVVKKASAEGSTLISGGVDSTYIGDSYYGWMIEKPADMQMDYRSFDGTYTSFMYDDDNYIYIDIYPLSDDYDFEEDYSAAKESMKGLTLIKAEKTSTSNYKKIHIAGKNQLNYYDEQKIITDKYEIYICGAFTNENISKRDGWLETLKTFNVPYNNSDTYDLSNIKNG
ncbi:MAG: copper amine oxidase N-terminal domain-containing protein, partial [Clostridia bacterium]|nr:copper amine oxidase N-terminal domain-containing protein [Clostridia bacterium]